jgi:hypothetical protein
VTKEKNMGLRPNLLLTAKELNFSRGFEGGSKCAREWNFYRKKKKQSCEQLVDESDTIERYPLSFAYPLFWI